MGAVAPATPVGVDEGGTGTQDGPRWRGPSYWSAPFRDTSLGSSVVPYEIAVIGVCVNRDVRTDLTTTPLHLRRHVP